MRRVKFVLEYLLNTTSDDILWEFIGTAAGLESWFADKVVFDGREVSFRWEGDEPRRARIVSMRPYQNITFRWLDSPDVHEFFELKMIAGDLTPEYILQVTDFAGEDEVDDMKELWDTQVEILRRTAGF